MGAPDTATRVTDGLLAAAVRGTSFCRLLLAEMQDDIHYCEAPQAAGCYETSVRRLALMRISGKIRKKAPCLQCLQCLG